MTVLRRDPSSISNYFDRLFDGIGHRGSSFTDVDELKYSHDGWTDRFLFMEFKRDGEGCPAGQRRGLEALSKLPGVTSWYLQLRTDGKITFAEYTNGSLELIDMITPDECRERFAAWWAGEVSYSGRRQERKRT